MKARALLRMLNRAAQIARNGSRPAHRCAHLSIRDGMLSMTATDGFLLLRQVDVMDAPDDVLAIDIEWTRQFLAEATAEAEGDPTAVVRRVADSMVDIELPDARRIVRRPISVAPEAERTAWQHIPTEFADLSAVQWASITDARYARKALAVLQKTDRCYVHVDGRWLNVWRHSDVAVADGKSVDARVAVLTASAPDATVGQRVRVNPRWLQQAASHFARTMEIGVAPDRIVLADRRSSPLTMIVIMGMRGDK